MSLTWNRDWILPYESLWSLFEKIKYANQINTKQLLQTFGTNESKKIKTGKVSKRHRNINLIEGLDVDLLEKSIGLNIEKNKNDTLQLIHRFIPHILQTKNLLNENLVYCRECLNSGYHSLFHQIIFLQKCPFHLCELETVCFNCYLEIPYQLPPHELESGFLCSCGESLLSERKGYNEFVESWSKVMPLNDSLFIIGLSLNPQSQNKIGNTILLDKVINNNRLLEHLIASTNENYRLTYTTDSKISKLGVNLYDEIYNVARDILLSYEKYLKKTILSEHLQCIKRFSGLYKPRGDKEFPEICPYAYAYIFWKESFYDINPFYNEVAPRKKRGLKNVELPFFYNNDSVKVAINYILKNFGEKINVKALSWIIKHMVWNVAKNHFQDWTVIAKENAAKSIRPKTKYDNFNFADLFSFVINENDSKVELYISKNDVEGNITGLICPYSEKKYKVNRDDEISHLPMRLAINPGFKNEKIAAEKYLARLKVISFVK